MSGHYGALIERFGKAWEAGDCDEMAAVFADEGVFVPEPHASPLKGPAAIAYYWRDIPLEQSEVSFRFGEIYVAGPWFSTEFKCTFRRRRTGEPVDLRGALFCEVEGEEIAEMRMYWHRQVTR